MHGQVEENNPFLCISPPALLHLPHHLTGRCVSQNIYSYNVHVLVKGMDLSPLPTLEHRNLVFPTRREIQWQVDT